MQQQQSNMVKPQKVGGTKKGMYGNPKVLYNAFGKSYKPKNLGVGWGGEPSKKSTKLPSKTKVMSSVKKAMGY